MCCRCFVCFKQKTAYEMRISDWTSDVCSSDLCVLSFPMGYTVTQHTTTADARLITDKEVAHLLSVSRSWSWKLVQAGKFPAPIKLSARCTRWRLSAVHEWMADLQGWQEDRKSTRLNSSH